MLNFLEMDFMGDNAGMEIMQVFDYGQISLFNNILRTDLLKTVGIMDFFYGGIRRCHK